MARGYGDNEYGADENRERWRDEDRERSSYGRGRDEDRGFFERAGDEIRSWFSDEDDDRSGRRPEHGQSSGSMSRSSWDRDQDRSSRSSGGGWTGSSSSWDRDNDRNSRSQGGGWSGGSSWDRDRSEGLSDRDRERSYGRIGRGGSDYMNQDRGSFGDMSQGGRGHSVGGSSWDRGQNRGLGPSRGGGYWSESSNRDRSSMGSYGENRSTFGSQSGPQGDWNRGGHAQSWGEANRGQSSWDRSRGQGGHSGQSQWDRSQHHAGGSTGYSDMGDTLGGFGNQRFGSSQDDHYRSWRDRQLSQLDNDYDDYCREREQQFHSDFDSWRKNRRQGQSSAAGRHPNDELLLESSSNAGVGTTTASMTGTAGPGSAAVSATGTRGSIQADTAGSTEAADTNDTGTGPSGRSRSRS